MNRLTIASIAEAHEDGELYSAVFYGNEKEVVDKVNCYFEQEEDEGHRTAGAHFESIEGMDGFDSFDELDDRHYHIISAVIRMQDTEEKEAPKDLPDCHPSTGSPKKSSETAI